MKAKLIVLVVGLTLMISTGIYVGSSLKAMQEKHIQQIEKALAQ